MSYRQQRRHCQNGTIQFSRQNPEVQQSQPNFFLFLRGYEQQEVTCNPNLRDSSAVWNVEDNRFPRRKLFLDN